MSNLRWRLTTVAVTLMVACGNSTDDSQVPSTAAGADGRRDFGGATDYGIDGTLPIGPCEGECQNDMVTACTCSTDDPCGWSNDGVCDGACTESGTVAESFDESGDCSGPCTGLCDVSDPKARHHVACTCAAGDPCGWKGDGVCDAACVGFDDAFNDSADCDGVASTGGAPAIGGGGTGGSGG